jgi:hypothetical protein
MVRPEAANARVRLANRARLLSSNARILVKPTLDLLANDVDFCSKIRSNFTTQEEEHSGHQADGQPADPRRRRST